MGDLVTDVLTLDCGEKLDLSAYPLPDGYADEVFNLDLMAQAMNTSTVTISKWISQGMPVVQRGGNGRSYELSFWQCYAWRKWKDGKEQAATKAKEGRAAQMALLFLGEEQPEDKARLTPKQIKEFSEAELIRNKAAQARGELVRVSDVQPMIERLLVSVRNKLMNAPDYLEQEFGLNARQVEQAQVYFDGLLTDMRLKIQDGGFQAGEVVSLNTETG